MRLLLTMALCALLYSTTAAQPVAVNPINDVWGRGAVSWSYFAGQGNTHVAHTLFPHSYEVFDLFNMDVAATDWYGSVQSANECEADAWQALYVANPTSWTNQGLMMMLAHRYVGVNDEDIAEGETCATSAVASGYGSMWIAGEAGAYRKFQGIFSLESIKPSDFQYSSDKFSGYRRVNLAPGQYVSASCNTQNGLHWIVNQYVKPGPYTPIHSTSDSIPMKVGGSNIELTYDSWFLDHGHGINVELFYNRDPQNPEVTPFGWGLGKLYKFGVNNLPGTSLAKTGSLEIRLQSAIN